jgi:hypothetical protein
MELSKEAKEERARYMRKWRRKNMDKHRKNVANYWERKAQKANNKTQ